MYLIFEKSQLRFSAQSPNINPFGSWLTDFIGLYFLHKFGHILLIDAFMHIYPLNGTATLPIIIKNTIGRTRRSSPNIRHIIGNINRVFSAQFQNYRSQIFRG